METQVKEILQNCRVEGTTVKLPEGQLDRKVYQQVAKALEGIGGKWKGGKIMGFVFPADPTANLDRIAGGEKVNLKKDFQFFATPDKIADRVVELADIKLSHLVLEPSAGNGSIVKAILRQQPNIPVNCYELFDVNRMALEEIENVVILGEDFLSAPDNLKFDRIVANPPFSKNQDIDHLYKMYSLLNNNGRVVCITSTHWKHSSNSKETEFRAWLQNKHAVIHEIPAGSFKESGTSVPTVIIVIDKKS